MPINSSTSISNHMSEFRRFITRSAQFLLFNSLVLVLFCGILVSSKTELMNYPGSYTRNQIRLIPHGQTFDFVLLGTSHTLVFSLNGDHPKTERNLGGKILNLAWDNSGVVPSVISMRHFFHQKNKTKKVIYLLDPWVMHWKRWNESSQASVAREKLNPYFFYLLLAHKVDWKLIVSYTREQFAQSVLGGVNPDRTDPLAGENRRVITEWSEELRSKRIDGMYGGGFNQHNFNRYSIYLENLIQICQQNHAEVVFILPPTLVGREPGTNMLLQKLEEWRISHHIIFYDLSESMSDTRFFYDGDHLNSQGIDYFITHYLKPLLETREREFPITSG